MQLVLLFKSAQDRDCVFNARLINIDRLETPLKRRVLLDILLIFIERGRADAMQFTAGQCGLEQVGCIHRTFRGPSPDQRVHLVNEQDDLTVRALHFIKHRLQPLFKLAAIFRARNQRTQVEAHQCAPLQAIGNITVGDAQREPFGNCGLARARLTDQRGVVLGTTSQDLDRAANLFVTTNHRIKLAVARSLREVARVFLHRIVRAFSIRAVGRLAFAQFIDRVFQCLGIKPCLLERLPGFCCCRQRQRGKKALNRDIGIAGLLRDLLCLIEHPHRIIVQAWR